MLVPGGQGTRRLVNDENMLTALVYGGTARTMVPFVCTGSALLAAAGVLDGRQATSKRARQWATSLSAQWVNWVKRHAGVRTAVFIPLPGVSAGTDMALAFIADRPR